jgi:hypothetical protein
MESLTTAKTEAQRAANRKYADTYYWTHRDQILAAKPWQSYYERNKDKVKERMKAYRSRSHPVEA